MRVEHRLSGERRHAFAALFAVTCLATAALAGSSILIFDHAGIRIETESLLTYNTLLGIILLPFGAWYTFVRFDQHIASICGSLSLLLLLGPALCMFTYATTILSGPFPLQDATFAALDGSLGFQWPQQLAFFDSHPLVAAVGHLAYRSILYQAGVALLALTLAGDAERLQDMVVAFWTSCVACGLLAGLLPAVGAYAYYGIHAEQHTHLHLVTRDTTVSLVTALRNGTQASFNFYTAEGIISFPSFHACLGLLFIWTFWPIPVLRWLVLLLNMALIAATPMNGSHYVVDVIAGLLIAYGSVRTTLAMRQAFKSKARLRAKLLIVAATA